MTKDLPPILTTKEVCELLRISRHTLHNLIEAGLIPVIRVGSHYRFSRAAILRYIGEEMNVAPITPHGIRH